VTAACPRWWPSCGRLPLSAAGARRRMGGRVRLVEGTTGSGSDTPLPRRFMSGFGREITKPASSCRGPFFFECPPLEGVDRSDEPLGRRPMAAPSHRGRHTASLLRATGQRGGERSSAPRGGMEGGGCDVRRRQSYTPAAGQGLAQGEGRVRTLDLRSCSQQNGSRAVAGGRRTMHSVPATPSRSALGGGRPRRFVRSARRSRE